MPKRTLHTHKQNYITFADRCSEKSSNSTQINCKRTSTAASQSCRGSITYRPIIIFFFLLPCWPERQLVRENIHTPLTRQPLTPAWLQSNSGLFSIVCIKQRGYGAALWAAGRSQAFNTELDYTACEKCGRKGFLMVQMMLPRKKSGIIPCLLSLHDSFSNYHWLWALSRLYESF